MQNKPLKVHLQQAIDSCSKLLDPVKAGYFFLTASMIFSFGSILVQKNQS